MYIKLSSSNGRKFFWIYAFIVLGVIITCSQANGQITIPKIILPTENVQALMRYGEIPIDYSTGIPNISIPLYTIKGEKLELPISISYHASGIKVQDIASDVGLGWVLNSGGIVSRSILGQKDELYESSKWWYKDAQQISNSIARAINYQVPISWQGITMYEHPLIPSVEDSLRTWNRNIDMQADRFYYSLPNGISGIFRYDFITHDIIKLPYRPLKIEKIFDNNSQNYFGSNSYIKQIKITDENGIIYTFEPAPMEDIRKNDTDFYLTKIETSDGTDSIVLTYEEPQGQQGVVSFSKIFQCPDELSSTSSANDIQCIDSRFCKQYNSNVSYNFEGRKLKKITTSLVTVDFYYDTNPRLDFSYMHRLNTINIVSNSDNSVLKTISFSPRYFGTGTTSRLGLESLTMSSPNNNNPEVYSFKYEDQIPMPEYQTSNGTYNEDYWGYNNNSTSRTLVSGDFIPDSYQSQYGGSSGNRNPDPIASKACMIKEVKYPTGGRTVFNFERNYAQNVYPFRSDHDGYVGGFRVQSIVNYNKNNEVVNTKTYEYSISHIRPIDKDLFAFYVYTYKDFCSAGQDRPLVGNYTIYSDPLLPLEVAPGLSVTYGLVTEYNGTTTNNTGYTLYAYGNPFSPNNYNDNPHAYEFEEARYFHPFQFDRGNYIPELQAKSEYSFDGTTYHPISITRYTYSKIRKQEYKTGIHLVRLIDYSIVNRDQMTDVYPDEYANSILPFNTYAYQEASLLTRTEHYTYDPTNANKYILSTTDLEYDTTYLQVTKQTVSTSVGNKQKTTQFTHPFDYTTAPYPTMVQMNNVASVIEKSNTIGGVFTESIKTNYANLGNSIIVPESIDSKNGNCTSETRILFPAYDNKGNLQYMIKDGTNKVVYLWGYNQTYPVAKIEGATLTEVSTALGGIPDLGAGGLSSAQAANLRSQLPNALVSTYTYKPLIGMATATDPKGVTTNYAYDTFNRLYLTRNDNKNIVAKYRYAYQNNPDNGMGGYTTLTGAVTVGTSSYSVGGSGSASISASGGSGSFSYSWSLLFGTTVLATGGNSNSFSFTCYQIGTLTVKCIVTDNNTGQTKSFTQDITCSAPTITYGNFTFVSGYTNYYNSLSNNGTTVSFILSFGVNSTAMDPGNSYFVAWLPDGFKPSVNRSVMVDCYGATWEIIFTPYGTVYCKIVSGSSIPVGGGTSLNGSYNL